MRGLGKGPFRCDSLRSGHANELYRMHGVLGCAFELSPPPTVEGEETAEQTCPAALHAMHCVTDVAGT